MNKQFLMLLFFCKNLLCPFEGAAYMGLHVGKDSKTPQFKVEQKSEQSQSWTDNLKEHFNKGRDWVNRTIDRFSQKSVTRPSSPHLIEPILMHDTAYEDDQVTEEQNIQQRKNVEYLRNQEVQQEIQRSKLLSNPLNVLNNSELLKSLTSDEINELNLENISANEFAKLSAESIKALFNEPKLLAKLSEDQIRALNPQRLSQALQKKLSIPLNLEFVKKLSWQQTRQILGDHTGLRLKNWFTKFKGNFTSEALIYIKNKFFDPNTERQFKNRLEEDDYLKLQLQKLPESKQPVNIDMAVQYMQDGKTLWNKLKDGKILNQIFFDMRSRSSPTIEQENILTSIFNGTEKPDEDDPVFKDFMKSYQTVIIKLQWYFYKLSILEDGRAFEGGTITFNDPDQYLFKFLDRYAQLLNPNYAKKAIFNIQSPQGYRRTSSHFSGQTKKEIDGKINTQNIGIDFNLPKNELGLPLNYPHLLFDQRSNGYVFMKCEPYGMGNVQDTVLHTWSFIKTRGENDESKHSKDRIPKDVMNEFWKLYKGKFSITKKAINTLGISGLFPLLTKDAKVQFEKYLTQDRANNPALRNYQKSTLQERRGGESIINP